MSASGRWFVTPHAVRRYIERVDRRASYEEALDRLIDMSARAHRVRSLDDGTELWRVGRTDGKLRFRVRAGVDGKLPQLVTVLFAFDRKAAA